MLTELISVIRGRKKRAVNSVPKLRQVLFTSLVVGTTVTMTGCTSGGFSISSMNPFSKQEATVDKTPGITEAIAESAEGTKSQLASLQQRKSLHKVDLCGHRRIQLRDSQTRRRRGE